MAVRRVVVLGPTASGKSDVAMAAAAEVPGTEIVAVDAMQVYRGMDIGTAKPAVADRAAVPHHGLDLVEPHQSFTVADFRAAYDEAERAIAGRGGRPLLVAGTGLYLIAVLDGLDLPGQYPGERAAVEQESDTAALYSRLTELDPVAAGRIEPGNRRRLVRALEVTIGSGRPFSSFGPGVAAFPPTNATLVGIRWNRHDLGRRIDQRVDAMVEAGLLDEVDRLRAPGLSPTAAQALGYKELLEHLHGHLGFDEAIAMIKTRTRQFAVRQERWFRRDPRVEWVDVSDDPVTDVAPAVVAALSSEC